MDKIAPIDMANAQPFPWGFILSPSATLQVAGPSLLGPVLADGARMNHLPQPNTHGRMPGHSAREVDSGSREDGPGRGTDRFRNELA